MRLRFPLLAAISLGLALAGCGEHGTPEDEIREVVRIAEESAEARDASRLLDLIAGDYRDGRGYGAEDVRRLVRGYLLTHQSIRLLVRIEEIQVKGPDVARLRASVGMLGQESASDSTWDFVVDVYLFDVMLAREDGEWRVTRAEWNRAVGG